MTGTAKLGLTAVLVACALGLLAAAAALHSAVPLFFMWLPLLAVPWVLARPQPGLAEPPREAPSATTEEPGEPPPSSGR